MLANMTRLACILVVGATALIGMRAFAGPRAKGKVVRVERSRGTAAIPRVCDIRGDRSGTCLGSEPMVGEIVSVLDETGVLAEVRITEATAFATGVGTCTSLWNIKTDVVRGDVSSIPLRTIGVVDPQIHPRRGRNLTREQFPPSPSGRPDDQVVIAVDRDGDGAADILMTQTACDGAGASSGSCLDEYANMNGRMVRVHQTNFATCGF